MFNFFTLLLIPMITTFGNNLNTTKHILSNTTNHTHTLSNNTIKHHMLPSVLNATNVTTIDEWKKCGGSSFNGTGFCNNGLTCVLINEYYSQCQFVEDTCNGCPTRYNQCDGRKFIGKKCCSKDLTCVKHNEYYSQCMLL
jgi:hypothetical protein